MKVVKSKYDLSERLAVEKYNELCHQLSSSDNIKNEVRYENLIYTLNLKNLITNMESFRGQGGFFYEFNTSKMSDVAKIINNKYQTLTYYGFKKNFFENFLFDNNLKGIDRIVPIGKALDIGLIWDGYDLNKLIGLILFTSITFLSPNLYPDYAGELFPITYVVFALFLTYFIGMGMYKKWKTSL